MTVPAHPMRALKGTKQGKDLMASVRAHKGAAKVGANPGEAANTAGADYADPGYQPDGLKRYPLDTAAHVRAAASYFGMPKNRGKYSPAQQKAILASIAAAKRKLGVGAESYTDVVNRYTK